MMIGVATEQAQRKGKRGVRAGVTVIVQAPRQSVAIENRRGNRKIGAA